MMKQILARRPALILLLVIVGAVVAYLALSVITAVASFALMLVTSLLFTGSDPNVFPAVIFVYILIFALINLVYIAPVILILLFLLISAYALGYAGLFLFSILRRRTENKLIRALKSEDSQLRRFAVVECGFRRLHRSESDLYGILFSDPDPDIRQCAYNSLNLMGQPAFDQVMKSLSEATDNGMKVELIRLLGKIPDDRRICALVGVYMENADRDTRSVVLDSLENINLSNEAASLADMVDVTREKELKLRLFAILHKYGNTLSAERLLTLLNAESDPDLRAAIFVSLDRMPPAEVLDGLLRLLAASPDNDLKVRILTMLSKYGTGTPIDTLINLLNTETDADIRLLIYRSFRDINDVRSNELFYRALKDEDVRIRDFAAATLKALGVVIAPREIVKEIVKVPCKYCGSLVDITCHKCLSCGAPLSLYG